MFSSQFYILGKCTKELLRAKPKVNCVLFVMIKVQYELSDLPFERKI